MKTEIISDLVLIEPKLKSTANHYLTYALDIGRAANQIKIKTRIVTDCQIENKVRRLLEKNGIEVIPIFPTRFLTIFNSRFINWPLLSLAYAGLVLWLIRKYHENTIICTLSGNIEYLTAAGMALPLLQLKNPPVVQMYVWESREYRSFTPNLIKMYRRLTEKMVKKAILEKKLIVAGQGNRVADHIQRRLGLYIPELPFIIDWQSFPMVKPGKPPYHIAFLGVMRAEKGFRQLVDSIPYIQSKVQFFIQAHVPLTLGEKNAYALIQKLRQLENCHILDGEIEIDEYKEIISHIDIIVLPYRPEDFYHKTSNILAEAIGLGKIVIAPSETALGKKLRELNVGVTYTPYTPEKLAGAIDHAVMHFEMLYNSVQKMAYGWKLENSADAFLTRLIEIRKGK